MRKVQIFLQTNFKGKHEEFNGNLAKLDDGRG
jgi:hypothetical protein